MDEDISLGERLTRTLSAMAFILPTIAAGFKFLADAKKADALANGIGTITSNLNSLAEKENTAAKKANTAATIANANATKISAKAKMEEAGANTVETMTEGGEKTASMFGNVSTILGKV